MRQVRIHIPAKRWGKCLQLQAAESHHLVDVLRLGSFDQVEVFDGEGRVCLATLVLEGKDWLLMLGLSQTRADFAHSVRLGVALLKGKKFDLVVRIATELGVSAIEPFTCTRSVPRPSAINLKQRIRRWRVIASEASRQSGRSFVPAVEPCKPVQELIQGRTSPFRAILHQASPGPTLAELLDEKNAGERFLLVGPEGGFSDQEVTLARDAGFQAVRLGLPNLRAETAAIVAVALACLDTKPVVE